MSSSNKSAHFFPHFSTSFELKGFHFVEYCWFYLCNLSELYHFLHFVFYRGEQLSPVVNGLVETVDKVMLQMASKLRSSPDSETPLAIGGKSSVAGQYALQNTSSNSRFQNIYS